MTILYSLVYPATYATQAGSIVSMMNSINAQRADFVYSHQALWVPTRNADGNYTLPWINLTGNPGSPGIISIFPINATGTGIGSILQRGLYELVAYSGTSNGIKGWIDDVTRPNIEMWRRYMATTGGLVDLASPLTYTGHFAFDEESFPLYSSDFGVTGFSQFVYLTGLNEQTGRAAWEKLATDMYVGAIHEWRTIFPKATFSFPYLLNQQTYNLDFANSSAGGQTLTTYPSSTGRTRRREIEFQAGVFKTGSEIDYMASKGSRYGWMGTIIGNLDYIDTETYALIGEMTTGSVGTQQISPTDAMYYYNLHADFLNSVRYKYKKPVLCWINTRYPSNLSLKTGSGINSLDAQGLVSAALRAGATPCLWINCGVGGPQSEAEGAVLGVSNLLPYLKLAKRQINNTYL